MEEKKPTPPMATVQIIACGGAGVSIAAFTVVALVPWLVGRELECFPNLKEALGPVISAGTISFFVAALVGLMTAWGVAFKKEPPTFGRLGGLAGALLAFVLLSTPLYGNAIRYVFGMSLGHYGPNCIPAGLLGSNPDLWHRFSRAMGYTPKPAPSTWPFY